MDNPPRINLCTLVIMDGLADIAEAILTSSAEADQSKVSSQTPCPG